MELTNQIAGLQVVFLIKTHLQCDLVKEAKLFRAVYLKYVYMVKGWSLQ